MNKIEEAGKSGKFFSAEFIKKDGTTRHIVAKLARFTRIGKTGKGMRYDPANYQLIPVLDIEEYNRLFREYVFATGDYPDMPELRDEFARQSYRMINLESVKKINGKGVDNGL